MQYHKPHKSKIICNLCRHHCKLSPTQIGYCGVNQNIDNKLKTLVYGYPSAINLDPIEKKPLFHFLPNTKVYSIGTAGCNFRCPFCQNWQLSQSNKIDKEKYFTPEEIVSMAVISGAKSIAFTYNEPTIFYPYAKDIALIAKENNIKTVYVSNGLESVDMIEDMEGVVDAINIDLKSFDDMYYKKKLKGKLEWVLDSLVGLSQKNIWLEITTLIIDGVNSDDASIEKMAYFISDKIGQKTPWHLSAFHPDYKMLDTPHTKISSLQNAYNIAKKRGLKYVYTGNVDMSMNTYCPNCNNEMIQRNRYETVFSGIDMGKCKSCGYVLDGVFV